MEKLIKDGKVGVLVSGGYGAGWYSWNSNCKECLFNPEIVNILIDNDGEPSREQVIKINEIASREFGDGFYNGGSDGLYVEWVAQDEQFEITEYDGFESINIIGESKYLTA